MKSKDVDQIEEYCKRIFLILLNTNKSGFTTTMTLECGCMHMITLSAVVDSSSCHRKEEILRD